MGEIKIFENAQFGQVRTTTSASERQHSNVVDVLVIENCELTILEDDLLIRFNNYNKTYNLEDYCSEIVLSCESFEKAMQAMNILKIGPVHNSVYRTKWICWALTVFSYFNQPSKNSPKTYLMKDSNTGHTKIGRSVNPRMRERTLQSEKPTITLFAVCEDLVESEIHKYYKDKRVRGEWFSLSEGDIDNIICDYGFKVVVSNPA